MKKTHDNIENDNSIYVYGKIYDIIEQLNNYELKCFINNEKDVDLCKDFKYKKKKKINFISTLDYYANFKNKQYEFYIVPIIFDKEYEILYIGVSIFFKENFWEEYKKCNYNYIELSIYNLDVSNSNLYTNNIVSSPNSRTYFLNFLINIKDLKNDAHVIGRYSDDCSDKHVHAKNGIYVVESKNDKQLMYSQGDYILRTHKFNTLYNGRSNYTSNVDYNNCNSISYNNDVDNNDESSCTTIRGRDKGYSLSIDRGSLDTPAHFTRSISGNRNNVATVWKNYSYHSDCNVRSECRYVSLEYDRYGNYLKNNGNKREEEKESEEKMEEKEKEKAKEKGEKEEKAEEKEEKAEEKEEKTEEKEEKAEEKEEKAEEKEEKTEEKEEKAEEKEKEEEEKSNNVKKQYSVNAEDPQIYYPVNSEKYNSSFAYTINEKNSNEDIKRNSFSKDGLEINKKETYYRNVCKTNEVEEDHFTFDKTHDREIMNYEYSYHKMENEMVYVNAKRRSGDIHISAVPEGDKPFISNSVSYEKNVYISSERGNQIGESKHTDVHIEEKKNTEIDYLSSKSMSFTKEEETVCFSQNEHIIKDDKNVHIKQSTDYRRDLYSTKDNCNFSSINSMNSRSCKIYEKDGKSNENETFTNFKSGFFTSKGNRTYNEDRVITIENINDFINKEYREVVNESNINNNDRNLNTSKNGSTNRSATCGSNSGNSNNNNSIDELFDKEYYDMLYKVQNAETSPPYYMYCAIYDGHNGEKAVNIIKKLLHVHVYSYFIKGNGICNSLKYAFESMDEHLCKKTINNEEDNHSNFSSGSTACVSIIFKNVLYIANIGDSRSVLSKNGRAVVVTVDHRASANKKEEERIIKSGGILDDEGYLGGCLGVCRGFGSFDKKTKEKLKGLVCEPDLFQIKLTDDDEFLIICCDGIFDVMTSQEAVNTVRTSLVESTSPDVAAEALCQLAYKRKSLDNLSVVVITFQNPESKKKTRANENANLYAGQAGRVRRR
ncbi:protein phosphatase PPM1 [Plasmodium brasilianum]|nr:protein phosphatase PPM1 [Plasmodium brasilianum]